MMNLFLFVLCFLLWWMCMVKAFLLHGKFAKLCVSSFFLSFVYQTINLIEVVTTDAYKKYISLAHNLLATSEINIILIWWVGPINNRKNSNRKSLNVSDLNNNNNNDDEELYFTHKFFLLVFFFAMATLNTDWFI